MDFYTHFIGELLTDNPSVTALISLLVAVVGWFNSANRNLELQKRLLAISLLNNNRFNENWIKANKVANRARFDENINLRELVKKRYQTPARVTQYEHKLLSSVNSVLNSIEFICVAIMDKTASERIIKKAKLTAYTELFDDFKGYIDQMRIGKGTEDDPEFPTYYIHFETVIEKWRSKPGFIPAKLLRNLSQSLISRP